MTLQDQIADLTAKMNRGEYGYGHTAAEAQLTQQKIRILQAGLSQEMQSTLPAVYAPQVYADSAIPPATDWTPWLIGGGVLALLLMLRR